MLPTIDTPVTNGDEEALEEAPMSEGNDAENDSSSLSEVSDSDIELSPLMSAVNTNITVPDLTSLPPLPSLVLKLPVEPVPTVPLGRGRRLSSSKRVNYYDQGQQGDEEASTSRIKPVASGKNVKLIQAARSGGKGKGGMGGKAGKGKMSYESMTPHPLDASASSVGKGGKGKGKKAGKTPSQIKKARMSFNNAFDSDEDDDMEMEEFYDDEEDELNDEDFYGEEEMYEYNEVAIKKEEEIGGDGQVIAKPVVVKKEKASQAKKAPRKATKKIQPVLSTLPPLPALPLLPTTPAATTLGPVPYPPIHPIPGSTLSTASSGSSITVDPYALPSPLDPNNPARHADAIPALTLQDGAGGGMDRGSSIKRGRGRPPKNGICAQRPRKPKPKPILDANGVEIPRERVAPAPSSAIPRQRQTSASASNISPYTLPPFPSTDAASAAVNATLNTTTFTPAVYAPGEEPPTAADPADLFAKPPFTYASLIAQAVMQAEERKLTLNGIYDWITLKWPYFSDNQNGWQVCRFSSPFVSNSADLCDGRIRSDTISR